jgi:hypothetical protein
MIHNHSAAEKWPGPTIGSRVRPPLDHHPKASQDTWGQRAIAAPTLTFAPSKRPFRSSPGSRGSPDLVGHPRPQSEVAFVVPMRFEVFWTVPGGRSVSTRAFDLEGELARRGIPLPEEIDVAPST